MTTVTAAITLVMTSRAKVVANPRRNVRPSSALAVEPPSVAISPPACRTVCLGNATATEKFVEEPPTSVRRRPTTRWPGGQAPRSPPPRKMTFRSVCARPGLGPKAGHPGLPAM